MKKRLYYLAVGIIVFLISYSIGAKVNIEKEQSSLIKEQFETKIKGINEFGIFQNNVRISNVSLTGGESLDYQLNYSGGDDLLSHNQSSTFAPHSPDAVLH